MTYEELYRFDADAIWEGDDYIFIKPKNNVFIKNLILDPEFLKHNTGKRKVFPGSPIYHFKGVDIPILVC